MSDLYTAVLLRKGHTPGGEVGAEIKLDDSGSDRTPVSYTVINYNATSQGDADDYAKIRAYDLQQQAPFTMVSIVGVVKVEPRLYR
jgi:hypothetical protein